MGQLQIRLFGDPVLREKARPVGQPTDIHRRLIDNMFETMRAAPGVGLAGPQVGVLDRIFVFDYQGQAGALIDPVISDLSAETEEGEEGCLSLPGLSYPVERSIGCVVSGLDRDGNPQRIEAEGWLARVFQHETDHLDGILFIDRLPKRLRRQAMRELTSQDLTLRPGGLTL